MHSTSCVEYVLVLKQFSSKEFEALLCDQLSYVVDAYEHALFGLFPRARYVIGNDAKFIFVPIQWLPEWLGDFVLTKIMRLPLPAACKKE